MKHFGGVNADSFTWRVKRTAGGWALDGFHMFSVLSKETGEWIGRIGPLYPHGWPDVENKKRTLSCVPLSATS